MSEYVSNRIGKRDHIDVLKRNHQNIWGSKGILGDLGEPETAVSSAEPLHRQSFHGFNCPGCFERTDEANFGCCELDLLLLGAGEI